MGLFCSLNSLIYVEHLGQYLQIEKMISMIFALEVGSSHIAGDEGLFTSVLLLVYFLWGHSPPSQSFRFAWGWLLLLASLANQCILSTQASVTGSVKGMWPSWSNETVCLPDEGRTYQGLRGPIRLALLTCPFLPSFSVFQPTGFQSVPWTRGYSEKHPPISDSTI